MSYPTRFVQADCNGEARTDLLAANCPNGSRQSFDPRHIMKRPLVATLALITLMSIQDAFAQTPNGSAGPARRGSRGDPRQNIPSSPAAPAENSATPSQEAVSAYFDDMGFVRGNPQDLGTLKTPLESKPGRNSFVAACRQAVQNAAASLGATRIEVVSAGPQKRVRDGYEAPVEVRVLYPGLLDSEVRHSTLTCRTDRRGNVLGVSS